MTNPNFFFGSQDSTNSENFTVFSAWIHVIAKHFDARKQVCLNKLIHES